MRTVIAIVTMLAVLAGAWAGEVDFPEEPLKTPVVVSHTSDVAKPRTIRIDAPSKTIFIEFSKGSVVEGTYVPRYRDTVTLRNYPDDEEGNPQPQEWDAFMGGTQIAQWCRAQPEAVTNAAVLRRMIQWILQQKDIIE